MQKIIKLISVLVFGTIFALWQPQTIIFKQSYNYMLVLGYLILLFVCIAGIIFELKGIKEENDGTPFFTKELRQRNLENLRKEDELLEEQAYYEQQQKEDNEWWDKNVYHRS